MVDYNRGDAVVLAGVLLAIFILTIYVFIMTVLAVRSAARKNPKGYRGVMMSLSGVYVMFLLTLVTILFIMSGIELYLYALHVLG